MCFWASRVPEMVQMRALAQLGSLPFFVDASLAGMVSIGADRQRHRAMASDRSSRPTLTEVDGDPRRMDRTACVVSHIGCRGDHD